MRLAIVTDAWPPQVNGVVTTMLTVVAWLREQGHDVIVIEPSGFRTIPCPWYSEIRLAIHTSDAGRRLRDFAPNRVHVTTEGPLGLAAIRFLRRQGWAYTTALHTRFPEYLQARIPFVPLSWGYAILRYFHARSHAVLVPTDSVARELEARGFDRVSVWTRGIDAKLFSPDAAFDPDLPRPIALHVGRLAAEKNVRAFLELDLPGTKVAVGDGPDRKRLQRDYPDAVFPGYRHGRELAAWYAAADVFVFPSRTDTYGVVMLEAMACGTPVAAYPVAGPIDVVRDGVTGCLDDDLRTAVERALRLDRDTCRGFALQHDANAMARRFLESTVPVHACLDAAAVPGETGQVE